MEFTSFSFSGAALAGSGLCQALAPGFSYPWELLPLRAFKCTRYNDCLTAAVEAGGGPWGREGLLDCTGCSKREDQDIADFHEWWGWIRLYAAVYRPADFHRYDPGKHYEMSQPEKTL